MVVPTGDCAITTGGGGGCTIEGPHLHDYEPDYFEQYTLVNGTVNAFHLSALGGRAKVAPLPVSSLHII